jgi:hypothetical protein
MFLAQPACVNKNSMVNENSVVNKPGSGIAAVKVSTRAMKC